MHRFAAKFLVMRRAGLPGLPARISIAHRAYTLMEALEFAQRRQRKASPLVSMAHWIERLHWPARRPARRLATYGHA